MNKNLKFIIIGFVIFLIGFIVFKLETKNFEPRSGLPSNFTIQQEILTYNISDSKIFRITNDGTDTNVKLYIDNNLKDEVRIIINHVDFSSVEYDYDVLSNDKITLTHIDFETSKELYLRDVSDIIQLSVIGFGDKVMYNSSLLEYPDIKVFVHEKYRENIQFVGSYGKVYNPIR